MPPNAVTQTPPHSPSTGRLRWLPFAVAACLTAAMLGWQGVHLYDTYHRASHKEAGTCVTKLAEAVYFTGHHQVDVVADLEHELIVFGGITALASWQEEYAQSEAEFLANLDDALAGTAGEIKASIQEVRSAHARVDGDVQKVFGHLAGDSTDDAVTLMLSDGHRFAAAAFRTSLAGLVTALDRHIARQVAQERTDELVSVAGAVALFVAAIGSWVVFARRIRRAEVSLAAESDRRQAAQRDLEQAQRMEALSVMAGGVAHDFENLTSVIWGSAASARAHLDDRERLEAALGRIELAAEDANDLVSGLLSFARRVPPVRAPLELGAFVRASEPLVRAALPEGVRLHIDIAGTVWVDGDEAQLRQALLNLIVNGGEAMAEGDMLTITVCPTQEGKALLTVSDTGTGMSPDVQERIFDPFFTTREGGGGTGLGLPIVRSIVADHGGTIAVESTTGCGSTFAITLPRIEPPADPSAHREHVTLLLVAPEGYASEFVAEGLRREGDTVVSATTAEAAAERWRSLPVDVLVVDRRLAGVLGRPDRPLIPAVLTADEQTPAPAGVIAVREPYTLKELRREVDRALELQLAGGGQ